MIACSAVLEVLDGFGAGLFMAVLGAVIAALLFRWSES